MFNCSVCHTTSQHYEKPVRVVTATREKQYPYRENANQVTVKWGDTFRKEMRDDPGGKGKENVSEALVCGGCQTNLERSGYIHAPSRVSGLS